MTVAERAAFYGSAAAAAAEATRAPETVAETETPLGVLPHQVRGFLHSFQSVPLVARAFDKCSACSHAVRHFV
jgi:ubiquitin-like modifier-activating enzyme ATG7